jgi:hypothetical protein
MIYDPVHRFLFLKNGRAGSSSAEIFLSQFCSPSAIITHNIDGPNYALLAQGQNYWCPISLPGGHRIHYHFDPHEPYWRLRRCLPCNEKLTIFTTFRPPLPRALSWFRWLTTYGNYTADFDHFIFTDIHLWENLSLFRELSPSQIQQIKELSPVVPFSEPSLYRALRTIFPRPPIIKQKLDTTIHKTTAYQPLSISRIHLAQIEKFSFESTL